MLRQICVTILAMTIAGSALAEDKPAKVSLDWATYNPVGMVVKAKGWLEEDLGKDGIAVEWTKVAGGPQSIGLINAGKADFGTTASSAGLVGKIDGAQFKAIYIFSKAEWTAVVVPANSPIKTVADLKGKRIAAGRRTDPQLVLARILEDNGIAFSQIEMVNMSHPDGKLAMESGAVDAWAGLDPMMAQAEIAGTGRILARAPQYVSDGLLIVNVKFAAEHPSVVKRVLAAYEKARLWALAHPDDLTAMMAEASGQPREVIVRQLERTDLTNPVIGAKQRETLVGAGMVLQKLGLVPQTVKVAEEVDAMIDTSFFSAPAKP
jgi:sulfonate transport system substrate-binding protein